MDKNLLYKLDHPHFIILSKVSRKYIEKVRNNMDI